MTMFKVTDAKTPEEYLEKIDEPRKAEMESLHKLIRKTVPSLKPFIISGMIGYGPYQYKSKSGREGEWCTIALASQKHYISVYICSVTKEGEYIAEKNAKMLGKVSVGKSCIRFKKMEDVNIDVFIDILKESAKLGGMNGI